MAAGLGSRSVWGFRRVFASSTISAIGDGALIVALPVVARTVTTSNRSIAAILFVSRLPLLLLSFGGAALADRADARRTMVVADVVRAGVLVALGVAAINDSVSLVAVYVTAFVLGLFEIPFAAAAQRMIASTIDDADLPMANARLATGQNAGEQFIGPALGGQLLAIGSGTTTAPFAGGAVPVLGDAVSFAASAVLLTGLPSVPSEVDRTQSAGVRSDIAEGLRFYRGSTVLRSTTTVIALLAFAQAIVNALLIQMGADTLGLKAGALGFFVAAIAIGNLVGGLVAERAVQRIGFGRCLLLAAVASGVAYSGIGITRNVVFIVALMILEGVVLMIGQVAYNVLRQRSIPRAMLGRVFTTTRVLIRGIAPFGALLGGEIAERHGVPAAMSVAGVLCFVISVAFLPRLLNGSLDRAFDPARGA